MSGTANNLLEAPDSPELNDVENPASYQALEQVLQISNTDAIDINTLAIQLSDSLQNLSHGLSARNTRLHSLTVASDVLLHQSYLYYFNNLELIIEACTALEAGNFQQYFHYCGEAFVHESLLDNARCCYEKSIALNPTGSKWSQHCMSNTLFWLGDLENSYLHGLTALLLDPTIDLFYTQLAQNLIAAGQDHEHIASCLLRQGMQMASESSNIERLLAEKLGESPEQSDFFRSDSATSDLTDLIEIFERHDLIPGFSRSYIHKIVSSDVSIDSPWTRYCHSLSKLFNQEYYLSQIEQTSDDCLLDYLTNGYLDSLSPNPLFDGTYYDAHSRHTRDKRISPLMDYVLADGWNRPDPHIAFSTSVLNEAGLSERKGITSLENYLTNHNFSISPCYWFNPTFYAEQIKDCPELSESKDHRNSDFLSHYLMTGWQQGLKPHRLLNTKHILAQLGNDTEPLSAFLNSRIDPLPVTPNSCIDQDRLRHYSRSIHTNTSKCIKRLIYENDSALSHGLVPCFDESFYLKEHSHIGAMCPRRHFLEYGLAEDAAPNLFFSHSYIRKRHCQYSFSDRNTVDTYYRHKQYKNDCLAIALSNCNDSCSNIELLSMLRYLVSNTDVDVYILAKHGGALFKEFRENAHIHVFKGTASAKTADYLFEESLEFLESIGVRRILFQSIDLQDWLNACCEKGLSTTCRLPVSLLELDSARIESILCRFTELIFDSEESLKLCSRLAPDMSCLKRVIPRAFTRPDASVFRQKATTISRDNQDLLITARGRSQQQLDIFQHVAEYYQKNPAMDKRLTFYWIDDRDRKVAKKEAALVIRPELFNLTVVDEETPAYDVLEAADIYMVIDNDANNSTNIIEAMAYGCAIYSFTDSDICREICVNHHVAVSTGDYYGMSQALAKTFEDTDHLNTRKQFSENLALYNHSIERYAKAILQYQNIRYSDLSEIQKQNQEKAIYLLSPDWGVSGVNTFAVNLVKQLNAQGHNAKILFTRGRHGTYPEPEFMPDVPHLFLQPAGSNDWAGDIWRTLIEFLKSHQSAVLLPNYDYIASSISPILPDHIGVIGISHSDDAEHYEHVYRLGAWWNQIVGVSERINEEICRLNLSLAHKTTTIRYGVPLDKRLTTEALAEKLELRQGPIKLIYSGRMIRHQKRVERYIELVNHLDSLGVDYEFTLLGDGPQLDMLTASLSGNPRVHLPGRVDRASIDLALKESHVFVLLSDFEGLPLSLLEAMAQGVIPLVSDIESGVHEILENKVNSFIFPKEDIRAFAHQISILSGDQTLAKDTAHAAYNTMNEKRLSDKQMGNKYADLIRDTFREISDGEYQRPQSLSQRISTSGVIPPPWLNIGSTHGNSGIHNR